MQTEPNRISRRTESLNSGNNGIRNTDRRRSSKERSKKSSMTKPPRLTERSLKPWHLSSSQTTWAITSPQTQALQRSRCDWRRESTRVSSMRSICLSGRNEMMIRSSLKSTEKMLSKLIISSISPRTGSPKSSKNRKRRSKDKPDHSVTRLSR